MANNYYEANGVLVLDKVTPVITALFGTFNLDTFDSGNGQVSIASNSDGDYYQWSTIHNPLLLLSSQLDLPCPDDITERTLAQTLILLAQHYHTEQELAGLLEKHTIKDSEEIKLDTLFFLATCFDDGHGLQEIRYEGAWTCDKPLLFEFGGHGFFISREVEIYGSSTEHINMGETLRKAILEQDTNSAADRLFANFSTLITGIRDENIRRAITAEFSNRIRTILVSP